MPIPPLTSTMQDPVDLGLVQKLGVLRLRRFKFNSYLRAYGTRRGHDGLPCFMRVLLSRGLSA